MAVEAVTALYAIQQHVSTGPALDRNLGNPSQGRAYQKFEKDSAVSVNGPIYNAMKMAREGWSASKAQTVQQGLIDVEDLPWPLTTPWSRSFLTSGNFARDFHRHAVYGLVEKFIVASYRQMMIKSSYEIGQLRKDILKLLERYMPDFKFPDGIVTPSQKEYNEVDNPDNLEDLLQTTNLTASFSKYNKDVEDIIKFCSKKSVMLANPNGSRDSAVVRRAFRKFIKVSGLPVIFFDLLKNILLVSPKQYTQAHCN